nr:chaperonin CPN60-2, mitochondrial [Tanacetum cinerariifolium]
MNLENMGVEMLRVGKKVTVSKDDIVVLDGAGDKKTIKKDASRSEDPLKQRWARKKDRVIDALNVTKAAKKSLLLSFKMSTQKSFLIFYVSLPHSVILECFDSFNLIYSK